MSALGYHLRTHLSDDRVIASTAEERRILARIVLEHGRRDNLYVFDCPDHHLHLAARCNRRAAGRLTQRITSSLKQRLEIPVGFVQYPPRPIEDNRHLHHVVPYILRQRRHHERPSDLRAESSSVADLLGLRTIGHYTVDNVRRYLPRLRRADVLEQAGLQDPQPTTSCAGPIELHEAMRSAGCLNRLSGATRELIALRTAAVAALDEKLPTRTLSAWLGVNKRTVQRLRKRQPDAALVHAIRLQLSLGTAAPNPGL